MHLKGQFGVGGLHEQVLSVVVTAIHHHDVPGQLVPVFKLLQFTKCTKTHTLHMAGNAAANYTAARSNTPLQVSADESIQ